MGRPLSILGPLAAVMVLFGADAARAGCAPATDADPLPFFAGIMPSDSILDVWCRLREGLGEGKFKGKLSFAAPKRTMFESAYKAERVFNVTFDPADPNPRMQLARVLQSVLPAKPGESAKSPDGQPFPLALEWVVQGTAANTPAGPQVQGLGIPSAYPQSRSLSFWMPVALKLTPVRMFGHDFHVQVVFRPHVARLLMALEGSAERLILKAAADKVVPFAEAQDCPADRVPDCKGLPPTVDLYTAWVLDSVTLTSAENNGLSGATEKLVEHFRKSITQLKPTIDTMAQDYTAVEGKAKLQFQSPTREMELVATGDPDKASGTRMITIRWRERANLKNTYGMWLEDTARTMRDKLVLKYGSTARR